MWSGIWVAAVKHHGIPSLSPTTTNFPPCHANAFLESSVVPVMSVRNDFPRNGRQLGPRSRSLTTNIDVQFSGSIPLLTFDLEDARRGVFRASDNARAARRNLYNFWETTLLTDITVTSFTCT